MHARDNVEPDVVTYRATIEALDAAAQHDECCRVYREARRAGHYASVSPRPSEMDLHDCSAAVARTILRCFLQDVQAGVSRAAGDVTVVTGKGLGSGAEGPVLGHAARAFLSESGGPRVTEVPGNAGRFVLRGEDLEAWRAGA